ncbi:hypothetical protein [Streptomyces sp. SPB074]|uniref:hypothetical protein n=1 Tax=Streptomyces sp. (strain SPB074) TaxID=465543 RepID=UPI00017F25A9|nr:hypothetical protein [Streptomyces sp. SPB074]EDY43500.1 hypothetical protein SSBG_01462 [Streptomyces sp. SPB074]
MSKHHTEPPEPGTLLVDANGKLGVFMGKGGPRYMLRPVRGGCEWEAEPDTVREPTPAERETAERQRAGRTAVSP